MTDYETLDKRLEEYRKLNLPRETILATILYLNTINFTFEEKIYLMKGLIGIYTQTPEDIE